MAVARNDSLSIGTTSVLASPARDRNEIIITNTGATNITISFGSSATAGAGAFLTPNAVYYANKTGGAPVWPGDVFLVGSAGGGTVAILEW